MHALKVSLSRAAECWQDVSNPAKQARGASPPHPLVDAGDVMAACMCAQRRGVLTSGGHMWF